MPPLHHLNAGPHPFWTFVQDLDDHPFFAAYNGQNVSGQQQHSQGEAFQPQREQPSENARGKQPAAEDPPEIDPATVRSDKQHESHEIPFRGRTGHGPGREGWGGRRGPGCRGRGGWGGRGGFGGPPPFGFGPDFWSGPRHHPHHHHHHRKGSHERERGPQESEATKPGFDLGGFLNNLGDRLGIDLAGAAENFGLDKDKFTASPSSDEVDFEPRTDIFDTPSHYEIHASLPGAKKEDVGVDWDGEHSILRVTGVVHRPGVDEELLKHLVVNGRKRENGLFEKAVRLGTKRDPASVDVAGITAKMVDGVLVIRVPKVDREVQRREVPISQAESTQPHNNEKDLLFDADEEMYEAAPQVAAEPTTRGKDHDARDERSVTAGREEETLPRYEVEEASASEKDMSDWERDSEEEGDYVKINVD